MFNMCIHRYRVGTSHWRCLIELSQCTLIRPSLSHTVLTVQCSILKPTRGQSYQVKNTPHLKSVQQGMLGTASNVQLH